jgi:hypothetical protein
VGGGERVRVEVKRKGRTFEAEAVCRVQAVAATVWETITDYPALPQFMPGIRACRVVERGSLGRQAERLLVEQEGEFRFILFTQSLKVRLDIEHRDLRIAHARALSFDLGLLKDRALEVFEGRYELQPGPNGGPTELRYTSLMVSRYPPPPGIGNLAVRQNLEAQLRAVVAECERRAVPVRRRPAAAAK